MQADPRYEYPSRDWHQLDASAVVTLLKTSSTAGLSESDVRTNLDNYGLNTLPEILPRSSLKLWLAQFTTLPVALLTAAACLCLFTGGTIDAVVIMGVVGINATIGYVTESQSEKIIRTLKSRGEPMTRVIRSGQEQPIATASVVPGDLLILRAGSFVAADSRVIDAQGLTINEAALTGESIPVEKTPDVLPRGEVPLAERINMVYKGTLVTDGQGVAIAVATGPTTELGKIQQLVDTVPATETPLQKQLDTVSGQLVGLSCAVCALVFGMGVLRGYALLPMLKIAISLAVAAVPEGLPTIATTTLALGIQEMRHRHIFIRTLNAVEALGAVQTICLDKTGTITENKMVVSDVQVGTDCWQVNAGKWLSPTGRAFVPKINPKPVSQSATGLLMQVAVLCSDAQVKPQTDGPPVITGSATETALIEMAVAAGVDVVDQQRHAPLMVTYARTQTHPVMSTIHQSRTTSSEAEALTLIAVKGNPAAVLSRCDRWQQGEMIHPLTAADRGRIGLSNQQLAGKALRVLGFAYKQGAYPPRERTDSAPENNLIWLGLVGLSDPIRAGVPDLIGAFHQAGLKTVMITGDQRPTARAIAETLQLSRQSQMTVLDATGLSSLSPSSHLEQVDVFSRVTPTHKLEIVQTLQAAGQIVAMTGDGINDTPALKIANVGIAMGAGSSDGVHEVADVVIADNNLKTLVDALKRGRTTYSNIRKSVHFLLSTNLSEIIVTAVMTTVAIGSPMTVMQLLWLNLVTDVFPGLALALEPPESDVLTQAPRNPHEPLIKATDFGRIGFESIVLSLSALGGYGYGLWQHGPGPQSGTILFMGLTIGQILHTLSCRSEKYGVWNTQQLSVNPYVVVAISFTLILQLLPMVFLALTNLLSLAPLTLIDWLIVALSSLLPLLVNDGSKFLFDHNFGKHLEKRPITS
ncbi:cation-translocating P-type ATPase [Leptolyngbya cf. ectocarpi LEGE 11479]|uniref:Cation-translocating P-type ATPase n=1 Tax=Leptolyngbya cf. ectocarpi LEGE 11479 TaxID=1828722 RepID=A0A928ZZR7_LEPEC|nr:cation-translocating P-type ATPase [Leptolyngbya cf. ectocarpi LEGE 11479]